jgi:hypothetical protein
MEEGMKKNDYIFWVQEIGFAKKVMTYFASFFSYLVSGAYRETCRKTFPWNVEKLGNEDHLNLWESLMYQSKGIPCQMPDDNPLRFMQIFGGWKQYVVLQPSPHLRTKRWFVGWSCNGQSFVVRITLTNSVRMHVGNGDAKFFGIDADTGKQIKIIRNGYGEMGSGKHSKIAFH